MEMPVVRSQMIKEEDETESNALIKQPDPKHGPLPIHHHSSVSPRKLYTKEGCILFLFALMIYFVVLNNHQLQTTADRPSQPHNSPPTDEDDSPAPPSPLFIFGHSTGHSGTGTFHQSLLRKGCLWDKAVGRFEAAVDGEMEGGYDGDCKLVESKLVPHLNKAVKNATVNATEKIAYVDLGHFHNRGRTLECLAKLLQNKSTFIHIRRNRYAIARSFTDSLQLPKKKLTPCISRNEIGKQSYNHPKLAVCPRSTEGAGPVDLPINDKVWDKFSTFQQFLWYADEMEHRWHSLQNIFLNKNTTSGVNVDSPTFIEVTWNSGQELLTGVNWVREQLGCSKIQNLGHQHPHVDHKSETLNCSKFLWEDLEYRKAMNFNAETKEVLFKVPQIVGGGECSESSAELEQKLKEYLLFHGVDFNDSDWKFAKE